METNDVERKLAAILAADVEGYSRLMAADEQATLQTLKHSREAIDRLIAEFHGRFVGSAGDSVLAEFPSAVDAVQCAFVIQQALGALNAELLANQRMEFRIGINLGDVIVEGTQIYGDGVNVAARLEGLADAGGVSVSGSVYEQVKNKLDQIFDDMGLHAVKNIAEPVRVYRLRMDPKDVPVRRVKPTTLAAWRGAAIAVAAVLLLEGMGYGLWDAYFRPPPPDAGPAVPTVPSPTPESEARLALRPFPEALKPGTSFQECADCPEMAVVPAGRFTMGSPDSEKGRRTDEGEGPQHRVTIARPFALGKYEVTYGQWDACATAGECSHTPQDRGWGRGNRPVIYVSWNDVQEYLRWLSRLTGHEYRLPSEAEWEYAARAGTKTAYWWGEDIGIDRANCAGCGTSEGKRTVPVGSFAPNAFGLYDVHGNVWEWTADCWNGSYAGAPTDGASWTAGDCNMRVLRSGAWGKEPENIRAARRIKDEPNLRSGKRGFRVVMTLP